MSNLERAAGRGSSGRVMMSSGRVMMSRRSALRVGILGLGLGDLLRLRALSAADGGEREGLTRGRSCILVWLAGGPSHLDTFDPKPEGPADVRGEFRAIETDVPGVRIAEVFPALAKGMRRVAIVRGVTGPEAEHDRATHLMMTGYRMTPGLTYPSMGSAVSKLVGFTRSALPPYVAVPSMPAFSASGFLTASCDPFVVGGDPAAADFRVRDLAPPDRLTMERLERRRGMIRTLDGFGRGVPATAATESRDRFAEQAYELLASPEAQRAFRLEEESEWVRDRYGRNGLGQSCLLARRLVEAGVPFVTINNAGSGCGLGWDTHQGNFPAIKERLAPPLDQGLSALLEDLEGRGLLEETLVVVMGEFGRTPKINPAAGRDHHGRASSVLLAGGGVKGGVVVGRTDERGDGVVERPVSPSDLAATIFGSLGIDLTHRFRTAEGQPIRLVDDGKVVGEVM